jgi:hypothetical protein
MHTILTRLGGFLDLQNRSCIHWPNQSDQHSESPSDGRGMVLVSSRKFKFLPALSLKLTIHERRFALGLEMLSLSRRSLLSAQQIRLDYE